MLLTFASLAVLAGPLPGDPDPGFEFPTYYVPPHGVREFLLQKDTLLFETIESAGTVDLNGDGDKADHVAQVLYGPGDIHNLGVALTTNGTVYDKLQFGAGSYAFLVKEKDQGADLNGDGDQIDRVLHSFDIAAAELTNSGMGATDFQVGELATAVLAYEQMQGETDMNGDGDANDEVVHLWAGGASLLNLGLAVGPLPSFSIEGDKVRVGVFEFAQGLQDLTGDGDFLDDGVLHLGVGASVANYGAVATSSEFFLGDWFFYLANESALQVDLNGDGDQVDSILQAAYTGFPLLLNLGLTVPGIQKTENYLLLGTFEADLGFDANGDGDLEDRVLRYLDLTTGSLKIVPLAAYSFNGTAAGVHLTATELAQGGVDLNGDGDLDDVVNFAFSYETEVLTQLPEVEHLETGAEDLVFLVTEESAQGDLNGDGDHIDTVLHHYRFETGEVRNLGFAVITSQLGSYPSQFELWDEHAVFLVGEQQQGAGDLNGDGNVAGASRALHALNYETGAIVNLGIGIADATARDVQVQGHVLAVRAKEKWFHGDVTGDGDDKDFVLGITHL